MRGSKVSGKTRFIALAMSLALASSGCVRKTTKAAEVKAFNEADLTKLYRPMSVLGLSKILAADPARTQRLADYVDNHAWKEHFDAPFVLVVKHWQGVHGSDPDKGLKEATSTLNKWQKKYGKSLSLAGGEVSDAVSSTAEDLATESAADSMLDRVEKISSETGETIVDSFQGYVPPEQQDNPGAPPNVEPPKNSPPSNNPPSNNPPSDHPPSNNPPGDNGGGGRPPDDYVPPPGGVKPDEGTSTKPGDSGSHPETGTSLNELEVTLEKTKNSQEQPPRIQTAPKTMTFIEVKGTHNDPVTSVKPEKVPEPGVTVGLGLLVLTVAVLKKIKQLRGDKATSGKVTK